MMKVCITASLIDRGNKAGRNNSFIQETPDVTARRVLCTIPLSKFLPGNNDITRPSVETVMCLFYMIGMITTAVKIQYK